MLGMKVDYEKSVILLIWNINLSTTTSEKTSRRGNAVDMGIDRFILKSNWITLCLFLVPEMGVELPKTGVIFYCDAPLSSGRWVTFPYTS